MEKGRKGMPMEFSGAKLDKTFRALVNAEVYSASLESKDEKRKEDGKNMSEPSNQNPANGTLNLTGIASEILKME